MQGRKNYTQKEIDDGRRAIDAQLEAYNQLMQSAGDGARVADARRAFDALFFNTLVLTLDRYFVHRLAGPNYEGKDGNPLNEVRIVADSLLTHDGMMRADKQIKLPPEKSVLGIDVGDRIELTQAQFERLADAFFAELERRFL